MKFDWDLDKSEVNYKKHRVRFEEAQTVFLDPRSIEFYDADHSGNEDRYIRIGISLKLNVLIVVFCEPNEKVIRIISARNATKEERGIYEKGI